MSEEGKVEYKQPQVITPEIQLILWLDGVLHGKDYISPEITKAIRGKVDNYLRPTGFIVSDNPGDIMQTFKTNRFFK